MKKGFLYIFLIGIIAFVTSCDSCLEKSSTSYISCDSTLSYEVKGDSFTISDLKSGEVLKSYVINREDSDWKAEDVYKAYDVEDSINAHTLMIYPNVNGMHYEYIIRMDNLAIKAYKVNR